jgi:hypothetical protein
MPAILDKVAQPRAICPEGGVRQEIQMECPYLSNEKPFPKKVLSGVRGKTVPDLMGKKRRMGK